MKIVIKSFPDPGHEGIPGKRGGSLPRKSTAKGSTAASKKGSAKASTKQVASFSSPEHRKLYSTDYGKQHGLYKATMDIEAWVETGDTVASGAYFGAAQAMDKVYKKVTIKSGDKVGLYGGTYFWSKSGSKSEARIRFTEQGGFGHDSDKRYVPFGALSYTGKYE